MRNTLEAFTFIGTGLVQVYLFIYLSGMRPLHSSQDVFNRNTFLKTFWNSIEFHDAVGLFINIHELSVSIISSHNLGHLGVDSSCWQGHIAYSLKDCFVFRPIDIWRRLIETSRTLAFLNDHSCKHTKSQETMRAIFRTHYSFHACVDACACDRTHQTKRPVKYVLCNNL